MMTATIQPHFDATYNRASSMCGWRLRWNMIDAVVGATRARAESWSGPSQ